MPVVKVYGVPEGEKRRKLNNFLKRLQKKTVGVKALGLALGQVSVFLVKDHVPDGLGDEIVVEISCLFRGPKRNRAVVQMLCRRLMLATKRFYPGSFVEVYDDLQRGYSSTAHPDGIPES